MGAFGQRFAIVDKKAEQFIYTDMGSVKFDDKMPRRSATVNTIEEARALKAKIEQLIDKCIKENFDYEKSETEASANKPDIVRMTDAEWKKSRLKYAKFHGDYARRLQQVEVAILELNCQFVS